MTKTPPPDDFDENPEWTDETFARARPANEVCPPHVLAALVRKRGRPVGGAGKAQDSKKPSGKTGA